MPRMSLQDKRICRDKKWSRMDGDAIMLIFNTEPPGGPSMGNVSRKQSLISRRLRFLPWDRSNQRGGVFRLARALW